MKVIKNQCESFTILINKLLKNEEKRQPEEEEEKSKFQIKNFNFDSNIIEGDDDNTNEIVELKLDFMVQELIYLIDLFSLACYG